MATRKKGRSSRSGPELAANVLKKHFTGLPINSLITSCREYPGPARVDLQRAIDELMPEYQRSRALGFHAENMYETLTLNHLLGNHHSRVVIGPLQYEEIDVGETMPARCVQRVVWLAKDGSVPFALIVGPAARFGQPSGTNIEVAVPPGEKGAQTAHRLLAAIENRVRSASSYRGKVISLGATDRYSGA